MDESEKQIEEVFITKDSLKVELALLFFGIFISLLLLEFGVRVFSKLSAPVAWRDRPTQWYVPESTVDNRDFYYPPEKAQGTFRVIVIGDSFTYGGKGQFDDAFPKRLERMLNLNEHQRKVEVLNWGVPGYSTAQEHALVRKALDKYHPDLIILEVTLNDPELKPYSATHLHGKKVIKENFIFRHWKTYQLVATRISATLLDKEYIQYYKDLFWQPATWTHFSSAVRHIIHDTQSEHIPVIAVLFPLFSHPLTDKYPYADIEEKVVHEFQADSFPILDLFPYYKNIPPERLQAIPGKDSHPNEIAHRIAADAIYARLVQDKILPDDVIVKKMTSNGRKLKNPVPHSREYLQRVKSIKSHSVPQDSDGLYAEH